jgi:oxygen-independent coproporphyrinogen-3 oxidase
MDPFSLYIHIPFCKHRCGYCDFNTYAGLENLIPAYVGALRREIEHLVNQAMEPVPVHTLFFGGGTPSLLTVELVNELVGTLQRYFVFSPQAEISLEANPGTLSAPYLEGLRDTGVNRLSIGMQSAHPSELRLLERQHDYPDVIRAVAGARQAGFDNLNLDLIFGLPEQTLESWQRSLELALALQPEHLALYALTIEHDTPFGHWTQRGLLSVPDPDLAAEMYEWASERLIQESYTQYEISNWARNSGSDPLDKHTNPSLACRHNLQYWRNLPYLGLGAGAHGYAKGFRTANVLSPQAYIRRMASDEVGANRRFPLTPATQQAQAVDRETEIGETMMMGLRLTREGVSARAFQKRFGEELQGLFGAQIKRLVGLGLLEWAGNGEELLHLTPQGRLLGNQVFAEFV